jgi:hypothetical protein
VSLQARPGVVLALLAFLRSAAVGGAVVTFLALSGAVSRGTTVRLAVGVVVAALVLALGGYALSRSGAGGGRPEDGA